MSRKNGKPRSSTIHANILKPSEMDTISLADAVESRFLDLCHAWMRIRAVHLPIPSELDKDLLLWRTMRVRHKRGDFRNTDDELRATRAVAQFTVDYNRTLRNQPPEKVTWKG